ncbi:MAG: hypothetical protein K6T75_08470 [Acetobacteraceae bacterium]|nr:hypothetical protein [Acetobacteraceae bacterium]
MYWEQPGEANTEATLKAALARARELGAEHLVVASNTGRTVERLLDLGVPPGTAVVCVTHQVGFASPGQDEMGQEVRERLRARGVKLLTATHLMAGIERAVSRKFGGLYPGALVAQALKLLGEGVKVAVEVAVMALDAGLIPHGREVVAVGGSGRGADAALVVVPAHSHDFFSTEVREIICKPRRR